MIPRHDHALTDLRHAERYRSARRPRAAVPGVRERVGMILVEVGLQLMVRGERRGPAYLR